MPFRLCSGVAATGREARPPVSRFAVLVGLLLALAIAGCVPMAARTPWPSQSYPMSCPQWSMPMAPICLSMTSYDGGFKYDDQFVACRGDVQSFGYALNRWYECVMDELTSKHKLFIVLSLATLQCLDSKLAGSSPGKPHPVLDCPVVDVDIDRSHALGFIDIAPLCVTKQEHFPEYSWAMDRCRDDVLKYVRKMKSAIENGSYELRSKANRAADDATRRFNCYARREAYCF